MSDFRDLGNEMRQVDLGWVQDSTELSVAESSDDLHLQQEYGGERDLDQLVVSCICRLAILPLSYPHFRCFLKFSARKKISRQRSAASLAKKASSRCSRGSFRQPRSPDGLHAAHLVPLHTP
jgi:hypothetical protein